MTEKITPAMQAFWANDPAPHEMGVELVEGRDLVNGYGGGTTSLDLPE